ncbi:Condensin-2 complex subunit H2, partial [Desmophyllum pertusum]
MPAQATSSNSSDVACRYTHLLQPIRDLTKNWDIDVAAQLEEYLAEIERIKITFDGGRTTMNFAEAALVIQGSACVYSKKVEYLYTLVYQTLDLIASKKRLQQAASVDDQGQDNDASFRDDAAEFLLLDDIKEAKNIDLKEDEDDSRREGSQIVPRTPLALIPLGERDKQDVLLSRTGEILGSRNDFKMNTCTVHASGTLLLDLTHLSLLDGSFKRLMTSTPSAMQDPQPGTETSNQVEAMNIP